MMPILFGIEMPVLGVRAHQANGLQGIVNFVGLGVVAVAAQTVAQDDGVDPVVVEERNEIGGSPTRRSGYYARRPPPESRLRRY